MIVIYGHRSYGAVDEQGGQYAVTRFAHIYYMPLFPTGSVWMTGPAKGIEIGLHGKSVLAAYCRTWGLLAAIVLVGMGLTGAGILDALIGLAIGGASIASWSWSKRRTEDAKLRGNLNALAFGTYCAPELMRGPLRQHMEIEMNRRQQVAEKARPPEDVARFGTRDLGELVRSYGVLSLHGSGQARAQLTELLQLKVPSGDVRDGVYRDNYSDTAGGKVELLPADRTAMLQVIEDAASQRLLR